MLMKKLNKKPNRSDGEWQTISALTTSGAISVQPAPFELFVDAFLAWMLETKITRGIYQAAVRALDSQNLQAERLTIHLVSTLVPRVVHELCANGSIILTPADYKTGKEMVWNNFKHQCESENVNPQKQWKEVASKPYVMTQIITLYMFPNFGDLAHLFNALMQVSQIGTEKVSGMEALFTAAFMKQEVQHQEQVRIIEDGINSEMINKN